MHLLNKPPPPGAATSGRRRFRESARPLAQPTPPLPAAAAAAARRDVRARGWLAGPLAPPAAATAASPDDRGQKRQSEPPSAPPASALPASHDQAVRQAQLAAERALADGLRLLEVEMPPVSIGAVAGDGDGQEEMNASLRLLRRFLGAPTFRGRASRVRVLFGDASEVAVAASGTTLDPASGRARAEPAFPRDAPGEPPFALGCLTRPNVLWSLTGVNFDGWSAASQVESSDEVLVVAYPTFNAKEELKAAREVWEACCLGREDGGDKVAGASLAAAGPAGGGGRGARRAMIVFNGELEKLREGYYPPMFFRELATLNREWLPQMETVYSVRNFRGSRPAALVRSYPGPWTLYRREEGGGEGGGDGRGGGGAAVAVWSSARRPSLKEVALELLPASDAAFAEAGGRGR